MNEIARRKIELTNEAMCLSCASIPKLVGEPLYLADVCGIGEREFTKVFRGDTNYWCDLVTGQLYSEDLQCLTSDRLYLLDVPVKTNKKIKKRAS